jgi:hypothetical protein
LGVIKLKAARDHIEGLANTKKPLMGLEELIWNSLDADASQVDIIFDEDTLSRVYQIRVVDDGDGIPHPDREALFGSIGGSEKRFTVRTRSGRKMHGKSGKGRLQAFAIGRTVDWISSYKALDCVRKYTIHGTLADLSEFPCSDPVTASDGATGVEVIISDLSSRVEELRGESSRIDLGAKLCLYLAAYPKIRINFDGSQLSIEKFKKRVLCINMSVTLEDGTVDPVLLTLVEWTNNAGRRLYLCDTDGIAVHEADSGIRNRNFNFTAYLSSPAITALINNGNWFLSELDPTTRAILKTARAALSDHFRKRESERSVDLVKGWRKSRIYPYKNTDAGPVEQAEREVFDICALKVHEYLPGFQDLDARSQRLTFQLISEALKTSPSSLKKILEAALRMPSEQQEELATLLQKTRLTAIINASKIVIDRLAFLESINELLFGRFRKELLERTQLHRILVDELWLFGEQYQLGVDDQGLKTLLEQHINILNRQVLSGTDAEVFDLDRRTRVLDLMIHRRIPQTIENCHEHLVIELKAPTCVINQEEIEQIKKYAYKVYDDVRFDKATTRWKFLLIGNKLGSYAEHDVANDGKERGHIKSLNGGRFNIYVHEWSSILANAKWRYEFFRDKLEYQASTADGMEYLKRKHSEYLPDLGSDNDNDSRVPTPNGQRKRRRKAAK